MNEWIIEKVDSGGRLLRIEPHLLHFVGSVTFGKLGSPSVLQFSHLKKMGLTVLTLSHRVALRIKIEQSFLASANYYM